MGDWLDAERAGDSPGTPGELLEFAEKRLLELQEFAAELLRELAEELPQEPELERMTSQFLCQIAVRALVALWDQAQSG